MIEDHPITLPPELVEQWDEEGTAMFRPEYIKALLPSKSPLSAAP
jgi:hypothetical protein